jgi:hypothetical protein
VDDLGAALPVEDLVTEGRRRLDAWPSIAERVPAADAVVRLNPVPPDDLSTTSEEWALLALVDGRRNVGELVALAGRGEYAVVTALAALVGRGLLVVGGVEDPLLRRHRLLSALEGRPVADEPEPAPAVPAQTPPPALAAPSAGASAAPAAAVVPAPAAPRGESAVIPARPEPFISARRPDHPEDLSGVARGEGATVTSIGGHGSVNGATAMQPDALPAGLVERDPSVNKSLLLRLIAGVRGL